MAKTVLITGATRGIGFALAQRYLTLGWNVIGAARDLSSAEQLQSLALYKLVQLDSSDEASILQAAKELEGEPIDLLINNAGIFLRADFAGTTKEDLMRNFEVNAVGPFLATRAFAPNLKLAAEKSKSDDGKAAKVVQISSDMASIANNTGGHYNYRASKAALNMINASLAVDLKSANVATFVLHPGWVKTDMTKGAGAITTDVSVSGLASLIEKLTLAETGKYYDYTGKAFPW
ncbi:Short chain dehydrogenase [Globisporangium polare]